MSAQDLFDALDAQAPAWEAPLAEVGLDLEAVRQLLETRGNRIGVHHGAFVHGFVEGLISGLQLKDHL